MDIKWQKQVVENLEIQFNMGILGLGVRVYVPQQDIRVGSWTSKKKLLYEL